VPPQIHSHELRDGQVVAGRIAGQGGCPGRHHGFEPRDGEVGLAAVVQISRMGHTVLASNETPPLASRVQGE
jgi:hypothetical protein